LPIKIIAKHRASANDALHFPAFSGFGFRNVRGVFLLPALHILILQLALR
jgi:hypothetical protein